MNETTPDETSNAESSEPDFYSLEETAARWTKLRGENTNTQTLLAYGVRDRNELVLSVYVCDWFLFQKFTDARSGEITITRLPMRGLVNLRKQTIEELLTNGSAEVDWVRGCTEVPDGKTFVACAVSTSHWGSDQKSWQPVFEEYRKNSDRKFPMITNANLVISKAESSRIERVFSSPVSGVETVNQSSNAAVDPGEPCEAEEIVPQALSSKKITALLLQQGVNIDTTPTKDPPQPVEAWPERKKSMARLPLLNEQEAAAAFAGIDLALPVYLSNDDEAELQRHMNIIQRNIEAGRLDAKPYEEGGSKWIRWRFTPEALAAWCAAQGIDYPLSMLKPMPATDAGLREALAQARAEIATLKARVAGLEQENARLQSAPTPPPDYADTGKTKGERQEAAVLHWIGVKGLNPMAIPDGDKGTLKDMCEKSDETGNLFTAKTAFDETWKRLRAAELVRMEYHASYAKQGAP